MKTNKAAQAAGGRPLVGRSSGESALTGAEESEKLVSSGGQRLAGGNGRKSD